MKLSRIGAVLGAVVLGGVLVASNAGATASAHPRHATHAKHVVHYRFVAPTPHKMRPHSNLRMGLHCDASDPAL